MIAQAAAAGVRLLGRLSPREQGLVALLAAAVGTWTAAAAYERAQAARAAAAEARAEANIVARLAQAQTGAAFRVAVRREALKVRAWSVNEPTVHLARLRAQADLQALAHEAGVTGVRVAAEPIGGGAAQVQPMVFTLEGDFAWPSFLDLLSRLAEARPAVTPLAVAVDEGGAGDAEPAPRFLLTVELLYLPTEPGR